MGFIPLTVQFPAILIAGTPNCGKSVLSYMLSQQLRKLGVAHYLLRAVPDGEGDWFMQGEPGVVRTLRQKHKANTGYSAGFVARMQTAVENRLVPLLVDVGGLPRGEQFGILRACTHAVLLYRDEAGRAAWQSILAEQNLPLIAELRSIRDEPGQIEQVQPWLSGSISGLDRTDPQTDLVFGALLDRLASLCHYDALYLEQVHLRRAQYPPLVERLLLDKIDPARRGTTPVWQPSDLPQVIPLIPAGEALSLYGRGPVWLAAAIGAHTAPAPLTIFDAREGWIPVPETSQAPAENILAVDALPASEFTLADFHVPGGMLEIGPLHCPDLPGAKGLVLSGKLPRWAFISLARWFAPKREWVAIRDANANAAIVIHVNQSVPGLGEIITLPAT